MHCFLIGTGIKLLLNITFQTSRSLLFRSKTIDESREDYNEFITLCENLTANDFDFLNDIETKITQSKSAYGKVNPEQEM